MDVRETIRCAVEEYGFETKCLLPVVEQRYNRRVFRPTGQYDWFSAWLLWGEVCKAFRMLQHQALHAK